ncbi:hypothetical protein D9M71_512120 [compost metagenome]
MAGQAAEQPEQTTTEQAPTQRPTQGGAAVTLPQGTEDHGNKRWPEQETAVTQVDDLQQVVAVHRPVADDEAQAGAEQTQQEQAEQYRLRVVAAMLGDAPANQAGQGQGADQQQVVQGHGQRPERNCQHQPWLRVVTQCWRKFAASISPVMRRARRSLPSGPIQIRLGGPGT